MPTARDFITDALRANRALGQGETLSDDDYDVALRALRRMLGTWANQNLALYGLGQGTMTLTPGTVSYSSALLSTGRPVSVDSAFLRLSGVDYPLELVDNQTYDGYQYKTNTGLPTKLFVDAGYPNTDFKFYFAPSAPYVAYISGRYPLVPGTITLDTDINLPEGYDAAIVDNLSVNTASTFSRSVTQQMKDDARNSLAWIKRTNTVNLVMETTLPFRSTRYNGLMGPL